MHMTIDKPLIRRAIKSHLSRGEKPPFATSEVVRHKGNSEDEQYQVHKLQDYVRLLALTRLQGFAVLMLWASPLYQLALRGWPKEATLTPY